MPTLFVDFKNGADANDGSTGSPLKTLTHTLASHAGNNDTIRLRGGNVSDEWYRERSMSTSLTGLTIMADTGHAPIFVSSIQYAAASWAKTADKTNVYEVAYAYGNCWGVWTGATKLKTVTSVNACDGATNSRYFDNDGDKLYINVGGVPGDIEVVEQNATGLTMSGINATVDGLTWQWFMQAGLSFTATGSTIRRCTFRYKHAFAHNNASFSSVAHTATGALVENCVFLGERKAADISEGSSALVPAATSAVVVRGCVFDGGDTGFYPLGGTHSLYDCTFANLDNSGAWALGGTIDVHRCTATDCGHDGFGASATATINAYNCVVNYTYDCPAPETGHLYGFVTHGNGTLYNCVVANLKRTTKPTLTAYNVATTGTVAVKNCIAYNCTRGIGDSSDNVPPAGGWDADYNCIYGCDTPYQTGYAAGAHDIATDPKFLLDRAGYDDFRLSHGSPCIDAGTLVTGVNEGFRGGAPDIGACEYVKPLDHGRIRAAFFESAFQAAWARNNEYIGSGVGA